VDILEARKCEVLKNLASETTGSTGRMLETVCVVTEQTHMTLGGVSFWTPYHVCFWYTQYFGSA